MGNTRTMSDRYIRQDPWWPLSAHQTSGLEKDCRDQHSLALVPKSQDWPQALPLQGTHWVMEARVRARLDAKLWPNHKKINWSRIGEGPYKLSILPQFLALAAVAGT